MKLIKMNRLLVICLCIYCEAALSQLNEADTVKWKINASVSGKLNTGNVERLLITPEFNLSHVAANTGFASGQRYTYGTFGKFRSENDLLSRNFFYIQPHAKLYPFIMLWMQRHERQRLAFRYQAGAGITKSLVKKEKHLLKLSLTGTYEHDSYKEENLTLSTDKNYNVFRATVRLAGSHLLAAKIINIYYEGYFQQALNNSSNWRVFAEGGMNINVLRAFGMKVFTSYEYQTVHVINQKPYDLVLNFGLTYHWQQH